MLDNATPGDFAPDEDVLRDAEIGKELELLKNNPNPGARRLACRLEFDRNSVQKNASRSRLGDTSQNFHQGRLARSVLANEHVNRALINGEIDLIERQGARITLGDLLGEDDDLMPICEVCSSDSF